MPTTASAALTTADTANAHRQSNSAASPPTSGAEVWPAACNEPNQPSARPSRSGGTVLASAANSSGVVNALATPCNARPPRNTASVGASAQSSDAAVYATYATRTVRCPPHRSPSVPDTTCNAANGSR